MLTLVHKCNVLTHAGDLWVRVHKEMGDKDYPLHKPRVPDAAGFVPGERLRDPLRAQGRRRRGAHLRRCDQRRCRRDRGLPVCPHRGRACASRGGDDVHDGQSELFL